MNTVDFVFSLIQCVHLMYSKVAWVLVSLGTQVWLQVILDPGYLPDYLSVSYDYEYTYCSIFHDVKTTRQWKLAS